MAINRPFVDPNTTEAIESLAAGGRITDVLHATAVIDFGSIAANISLDSDVTIAGARENDICIVAPPYAPDAEIQFTAFVESANTVTVRAGNNSAGAVDPASGTYRIMVYKFAEGV